MATYVYTYVTTNDPKHPPHSPADNKNAGTHMGLRGLRELALAGELLNKDAEAVVKGAGYVALAFAFGELAESIRSSDEKHSEELAALSGLALDRGIDLAGSDLRKPLQSG